MEELKLVVVEQLEFGNFVLNIDNCFNIFDRLQMGYKKYMQKFWARQSFILGKLI